MPESSFRAVSVPFGHIEKLAIGGGASAIYANQEPNVAVAGDWRDRHCHLADTFQSVLERVHNFEVREDDVWIVTSAKCGTTWAQEMTWLIMNDFDFEKAKEVDLTIRSPFLEFNGIVANLPYDTIEAANNLPSPRLIKSHLPAWLLPKQVWTKKPKIIYVFRNPKDASISYYHHWCGMVGYPGTKEEFMQSYMDGYVNYNPFWEHVLDFWQLRNEAHVFFTSYESMKLNLAKVIQDICYFLKADIRTDQLMQLIDHLSFDKMKDNPSCNHAKEFESMKAASGREVKEFRFVRRGIVGSHKDELTKSVVEDFDQWTEEHLKPHSLVVDDFINFSKY